MAKKITCIYCGAKFKETLPKCPYCQNTNIKGAELAYMQKLQGVRNEMGSLQQVPVQEVKKEVRKQGKIMMWVFIIALLVVVAFLIVVCLLSRYGERENKEVYVWQHENFPAMDELYEEGQYYEVTDIYWKEYWKDNPVADWEHGDFCREYIMVIRMAEYLDKEKYGKKPDKSDCESLLFYEVSLLGVPDDIMLDEEEKEILRPYVELAKSDIQSRFGIDPAQYEEFKEEKVRVDFIKEWYQE